MRKFSLKLNFWFLIITVLTAGTAGTLYTYQSVLKYQRKIAQAEFKQISGDRVASLQSMINTDLTSLLALQSFFTATPHVSREEFGAFTEPLLRFQPHVDAYYWIPRVTDSERASFEKAASKGREQGFKIREMDPDGQFVFARKSAEYYPTLYAEPFKKNYFGLGFNQSSVAERRRCMVRAAASKTVIATRIHPYWRFLPDEQSDSFFVFLPVYENGKPSETSEHRKIHLKGFVAAGFRVDRLVQATFTTLNMSELDLEFYAETVDAQNKPVHYYQSYGTGFPSAVPEYTHREVLVIADQRWMILAKSTEFFRTVVGDTGTRSILLAGFLLTFLLCAFLILWEQRKRQEYFLRMSFKDELTDLYNRRGFLTLAKAHLKLARRKKMESMLLFADLDGLKEINDTYGHEEGDKALVAAAKILRGSFRDSDLVARTGGDEFIIFAFDIGHGNEEALLRHLNHNMELYNSLNPHPYKVQMSVGSILMGPDHELPLEKVLAQADKEMYVSKRNHRKSEGSSGKNP